MPTRLITRTIYGSALQTSKHLGLEHALAADSTLNEAVDLYSVGGSPVIVGARDPDAIAFDPATDTQSLKTQYIAIGNGGHKNFTGADGAQFTGPLPHRATDAGLYKWLPLVLRLPANDLSSLERANYRLRRVVTIGGQEYVAYFLKVLDMSGVSTSMQRINVVNGVPQAPVPFVPGSVNLQPTAPTINQPGVFPNDGSYLSASATVTVAFTAAEIAELINVVEILTGNELNAIISEVALVSAMDGATLGYADNGGSWTKNLNYTDVAGAQINMHFSSYYPLAYINDSFSFDLNMGATEPLFGAGGL